GTIVARHDAVERPGPAPVGRRVDRGMGTVARIGRECRRRDLERVLRVDSDRRLAVLMLLAAARLWDHVHDEHRRRGRARRAPPRPSGRGAGDRRLPPRVRGLRPGIAAAGGAGWKSVGSRAVYSAAAPPAPAVTRLMPRRAAPVPGPGSSLCNRKTPCCPG